MCKKTSEVHCTLIAYIGIKIWMHDSTFYSKKHKCPLMSLFYLEIIDHTLLFLFIQKMDVTYLAGVYAT